MKKLVKPLSVKSIQSWSQYVLPKSYFSLLKMKNFSVRRMRVTLFDESFTIFGELVKSESVSVEWWATILAHVIHSHYIFILQHHFVGRNHERKNWREKIINSNFWEIFAIWKFLKFNYFRIANRSKWNWTRTSLHLAESNVLDTSMPHPTAEERKKLEHLNRERPGSGIPVSVTLFLRFRKSRSVYCSVVNGAVMRNW